MTQEPKLGRTWRTSPQFISISDGSWLGMSACIERTMQRSSTHSPTFEKISLTSVPLWPNFRNLNGEGNAAPVRRSVFSVMGIGLPAYLASDGLGSNVSTCDAPPFMNRWMTRLALAGSGGCFGASGLMAWLFGAACRYPVSPSVDVSATRPMPMPQRDSISRRVINSSRGFMLNSLPVLNSEVELWRMARSFQRALRPSQFLKEVCKLHCAAADPVCESSNFGIQVQSTNANSLVSSSTCA